MTSISCFKKKKKRKPILLLNRAQNLPQIRGNQHKPKYFLWKKKSYFLGNLFKGFYLCVTAKKLTTKRKATESIIEEATKARNESLCSLTPSTAVDDSEQDITPASSACKKLKKQSSIGSFFSLVFNK